VTFSKAFAWFGLTVLIVRLARRVPLAPRPNAAAVLVHLAAAAAAVFVDAAVESGVRSALLDEPVPLLPIVTARTDVVLFYYTAIVAIVHAGAYWRRLRVREVEAVRLESALTSARLTQLQAQLQPHFLFNALQAIASLIDDDPAVAQRMIDSLSRLLRLLLESRAEQLVPLARELEMLRCYVDIERVRHEDWLSFDIAADEAALDVPVPNFMLQPLVENAIRHGFRGIDRPGTITVRAHAGAGVLGIDVHDDGTGMHGETEAGFGIGLGALRERLQRLYGAAHRFEVEAMPGRGTHIRIEVPLAEG
jgi:hypothetical protein